MVPPLENKNSQHIAPSDTPFMSNMDEISYWVHTKRAPCLYNYDKTNNTQNEQPHCSKFKPKCNAVEVPSPKKKIKRKLVLLDDDSDSTERQQNVYFDTSQGQNQRSAMSNGKPSSVGSDVDFNIKNSSTRVKAKRIKLQKNSKMSLEKKGKIVTSTPKVTLRRSLRKSHQNNNNSQLDSSFEMMNNGINQNLQSPHIRSDKNANKTLEETEKLEPKCERVANQIPEEQNAILNEKSKNDTVLNGEFEDMSDVSGFTANYIRSTKINSSRTPHNVRNKLNRTFIKESQKSLQKENTKTIMCVNKSMNTGLPDSACLNCSTDSSQNVINLITLKSIEKPTRLSRATSLLKFMDPKLGDSKESLCDNEKKQNNNNLNASFQSNGTSRYPKRHKQHTDGANTSSVKNNHSRSATDRRKKICKNSSDFNNSDRKENPEEEQISRTRSGRTIGLKVRQAENSVLVLSNSTEQVSSMTAVNVAGPTDNHSADDTPRKKRQSGRCRQLKKPVNKSRQSLKRDSLRDKSGFAACFSESDDDSEQLKERKFFC